MYQPISFEEIKIRTGVALTCIQILRKLIRRSDTASQITPFLYGKEGLKLSKVRREK